MHERHYAVLVPRESTHAVYRNQVQVRLRPAPDPAQQAQLVSAILELSQVAGRIDPTFSYEITESSEHGIAVEFEVNHPERLKAAIDQWAGDLRNGRPEVWQLIVPAAG